LYLTPYVIKAFRIGRHQSLIPKIMQNINKANGMESLSQDINGFPIEELGQEASEYERCSNYTFMEKQLPSLVEATHSAKDAMDKLSGMSPDILDTMKAYQNSASSITEAASHFSNLIKEVKKMLEVIPVVKPFLSKILDALTLVYDIIMGFLNKSFYLIPSAIVRLFQLFGVDAVLIDNFVKSVIKISCSKEIVEGTIPARPEAAENLFNIFTEGIGTLITGKTPDMSRMKYVNESLRYKSGILREYKDMTEFALQLIRMVPDQVQIWLTYVIPTQWWLKIFAPGTKFYTWIDEVNSLDSHIYTVQAAYDHKIQQQIMRLYATGQELLKECTDHGTKVQQVYKLLESSFKKVDALFKIVDMSALNRGGRRVPYVVYLYGLSGTGKSFLTTIIPAILAGCPADTPNLSWGRSPAVQHWDGYTGQFAVKYDDFGAVTNSGGVGPGDIGEMITIVSNEQMRLPMASLEDKGEVFRSQVVVVSSNNAFIAATELRCAEALNRRRHFFYEVIVKQEFCKPGTHEVNPELIPSDYSHWEFRERHNQNQSFRGEPIGYVEFIKRLKAGYKKHVDGQVLAAQNYEKMIEEANLPMRPDGLANDFAQFMSLNNRIPEESGRKLFSDSEGAKFYQLLEEIDKKWEKPLWYEALMSILPFAAIVGGLIGISFTIQKFRNDNQKKSEKKIQGILSNLDKEHQQARDMLGNLAGVLNNTEVRLKEPEGRWDDLYQNLRGATPEMVKIFNDAMEDCDDFSNLSNEEVEEIIRKTLLDPKVRRFLRAEGVYSGHYAKTQGRMAHGKPVVKMPVVVKHPEGSIDQNAVEVTMSRLVPNMARISINGYNNSAVMIGGRVVLTNYHTFCGMDGDLEEEGCVVELTVGQVKYRCEFSHARLCRIGIDAALYQMEATMALTRDITRHFITEESLKNMQRFPAMMAASDRNGIPVIFRITSEVRRNTRPMSYTTERARNDLQLQNGVCYSTTKPTDISFAEATAWAYQCDSMPGMCGSAIVQLEKMAARKIVGIHAASDVKGLAIAQIVTEEMLRDGLRYFGATLQPYDPKVDANNPELGLVQPHGNLTKVGVLFKHPRSAETTKIIPSLLHGQLFEPKTAPAVLNPMDPRAGGLRDTTPLRMGIEKYGKIAPLVNGKILKRVIENVKELMSPLEGKTERRILTQAEALNGIVGDDFIKHMDMKTSAGFPWNQNPLAKGKWPYIQHENPLDEHSKYIIVDKELQRKVDTRFVQAKKGNRVESLWIDTLKDERRSLEKVFEGKTRVFTNPPVDFSIVCRRLFGAFNSAFYANRLKYFSAVGIDPGGLEWTIMFQELQNNSDIGFGGDFSGWDGNLSPQFLMGICDVVNYWYNDCQENQIAREVIFDEIIHTPQVALNEVYYTHLGNPSGNPLTVIVNTIAHFMKFLYCYYKIVPKDLNSLQHFEENIKIYIYGDDGIVSIKKEILKDFSPDKLSDELEELNLKYTNSSKTGPAEIVPIRDLTFLKRGFRQDKFGRELATIDKQTIHELTNWTRKCADMTVEEASVDNLNDALGFMYAYGKEQFNELRDKIKEKLKTSLHSKLRDYTYFHQLFRSKCEDLSFVPARPEAQVEVPINALADSTTPITTNKGDEIRTTDNTKGIILESQREVEVSGPTLVPKSGTKRLTGSSMPDPRWSLNDMVNRRVWVNTYTWSVSQSMGTAIATLHLPSDVIVNYLQSAAFERFVYWRGTIALDFELSGMRQQLGRLKIFAVPFTDASVTTAWHLGNPQVYYGLNPLSLDPSSNIKDRLVIPFYNPRNYISINGPAVDANIDFTATVLAVVLVPLGSATCAQQQINMTIWASFLEDSEFHVPLNSSATGRSYNQEHARRLQQSSRAIPMRPEGGQISTTNNVTAYGNMDGTCIPMKMTNDDFQGAASGNQLSVPAFDRAARSINPINVVRKYIQNFAHSKGSELVTRMDLDPSNLAISIREHFSTNENEMAMEFLISKPTWVQNIAWPGTTTYGTSLYSAFIGPMFSLFTPGTTTQVNIIQGQQVKMTLWEYATMNKAFWRGPVRVRLELVATAFHVGRLCLTINYGAPPGIQSGLRDATSQYAVEFELSNEKSTFEYDIPFVSPTAWKRTCRGPSSPDDPEITGVWWNDYFTGSFDISVVTQLQTVCNSPPDAVIVLSMCAGPGYNVYMPSNINQSFQPSLISSVPIPMRPESEANKAGSDATPSPPEAPSTIVPAKQVAPPDTISVFGDTLQFGPRAAIRDIREELRRYYPRTTQMTYNYVPQAAVASTTNDNESGYTPLFNTATIPTNTSLSYCIFNVVELSALGAASEALQSMNYSMVNYNNPLLHYGCMYRFWRGSQRRKVIFGKVQSSTYVEESPANSGLVFIPHGQYVLGHSPMASRPNWAWISANIANGMLGQEFVSVGGDAIGYTSTRTGTNYAQDLIGHDIVNYSEIEIPYTSLYNVLPTSQGVLAADLAPDLQMVGVLIAYTIFSIPYTATPGTAPINRPITMLTSVGDDFRLGTFLGMPNIYPCELTPGFLWPDTWVITPPSTASKLQEAIEMDVLVGGKKKQESDEEFEKMEPESMTKSILIKKLHQMQQKTKPMRPEGSWWSKEEKDHWMLPRKKLFFYPGTIDMNFDKLPPKSDIRDYDVGMAYALKADVIDFSDATIYTQLCRWKSKHGLTIIYDDGAGLNKIRVHWIFKKNIQGEEMGKFWNFSNDFAADTFDIDNVDLMIYTQIYVFMCYVISRDDLDQNGPASTTDLLKIRTDARAAQYRDYLEIFNNPDSVAAENFNFQGSMVGINHQGNYHMDAEGRITELTHCPMRPEGDTVTWKTQTPTTAHITLLLTTLYSRYEKEEDFNARMAMNEFQQIIETAKIESTITKEGPDHKPHFMCISSLSVDNPTFNSTFSAGKGGSKKYAEEQSMFDMMEELINRIPPEPEKSPELLAIDKHLAKVNLEKAEAEKSKKPWDGLVTSDDCRAFDITSREAFIMVKSAGCHDLIDVIYGNEDLFKHRKKLDEAVQRLGYKLVVKFTKHRDFVNNRLFVVDMEFKSVIRYTETIGTCLRGFAEEGELFDTSKRELFKIAARQLALRLVERIEGNRFSDFVDCSDDEE